MLAQLARQWAQGAEIAPLAAEVGVGEGMVTTQAAKQHGFEVFISPHYFFPTDRGWKFEIVDMDGRKIDKLLVSALVPAAVAEA